MPNPTLKLNDGATQFRLRLTLSLLTNTPLLIRNIRSSSLDAPGLTPYEISYLRLIDGLTNGTQIEINATGTQLKFKPGILVGGEVRHDCPVGRPIATSTADTAAGDDHNSGISNPRSIGFYLEYILPLAPFCKSPISLTLTGITDGLTTLDPSPDYLAASHLHLLQSQFGLGREADEDYPPSITVIKRGAAPLGGGVVKFYSPIVKRSGVGSGELLPIDCCGLGKIKRVRGKVVCCKIPPSSAARAAHSAKGVMHRLLPDVWVHTDSYSSKAKAAVAGSATKRGKDGCGPSPGMTIHLIAQSTEGHVLAAETSLDPTGSRGRVLPEDLGQKAAALLLEEIRRGGCIDTGAQSLAFILMSLGPEDVARIRVGTLSKYSVETLRLIKKMVGVEFKVTGDEESKTVILSCLGSGYRNYSKAST